MVERRPRRHPGRPPVRRHLLRIGAPALFAVVGPGILAGLSDDDPAGITTYSILGARYGYALLWVLLLSTLALIVFHELGARLGVVTGRGLLALVRERYGHRRTLAVVSALVLANIGTTCAEFAGVAAALGLAGVPRWASVPVSAVAVSLLVLRGSFHRIEHVLLVLGTIFLAYVADGILAHPDWAATAHGLVVPHLPLTRDAVLVATGTLGTTLAPWGLAFIQSYAADKHIAERDLRYERWDVVTGAVMTGVIGLFVVVACAATLHVAGHNVNDAHDAALALRPLAGGLATGLFGAGLLGASLLAAAILPLSTAYSVSEAFGHKAALDDTLHEAPFFYGTYAIVVVAGAAIVLIPGAPLVPILFFTQVANAVLLLPLLVVLMRLGRDRTVLGEHVSGRLSHAAALGAFAVVALAVGALAVLGIVG